MRDLPFDKMHGCGNDFVILDEEACQVKDWPGVARTLCQRRYGVGADGVIALRQLGPGLGAVRFYNADGSLAEMCGNGARCAAHWLASRAGGVFELELETQVGRVRCVVALESGAGAARVSVQMGQVTWDGARDVPAWAGVSLDVDGTTLPAFAVSMGNPHLVLLGSPPEALQGAERLSQHPAFAHGCNVEWVQKIGADRVRVDVYERGVGPTLACGTGACASVAALIRAGQLDPGQPVQVELPGGVLEILVTPTWEVTLTGQSVWVYSGVLR